MPPSFPSSTDPLADAVARAESSVRGPARLEESVLEIVGEDARDFLVRMSATALAGVPSDRWQATLFTNAQGRVLAWCRLLIREEGYLLAVPGSETGRALEAHLVRHRLRSRFTTRLREDLTVWADPRIPGSVPAALRGSFRSLDGTSSYALEPSGITIRAEDTGGTDTEDPNALRAWRLREFRDGIVRLPASLSGAFTVPALGPFTVAMVALRKGCFPGQEVVRKMLRLGAGKRVLAWGEADAIFDAGTVLDDEDGRERASVLASLAADDRVFVQLVIREEPTSPLPSLHAAGRPGTCRVRALLPAVSPEAT
jgi:folate-binding protein YgfZ